MINFGEYLVIQMKMTVYETRRHKNGMYGYAILKP